MTPETEPNAADSRLTARRTAKPAEEVALRFDLLDRNAGSAPSGPANGGRNVPLIQANSITCFTIQFLETIGHEFPICLTQNSEIMHIRVLDCNVTGRLMMHLARLEKCHETRS